MRNYFKNLPRGYRSGKSVFVPLVAIGIALFGLISVVSFISDSYDIRNLAAKPGSLGQGCYYVRGDCTGTGTTGATGSCKPRLVCPTATPLPTATPMPTATPAPSLTPMPTAVSVNPVKFKCTFRPDCLDANPPCTDAIPLVGWCVVDQANISFSQ